MKNSEIIGIGHFVPEQVVSNYDLEKMMDTSNDWIIERTGIRERRWIKPGETTIYGMAHEATRMALERAQIDVNEIEFIVFASIMGDHGFPGGGCFLGERLGLHGVPAMDIRNACSGFIYALSVADKFIKSGTYKTALVIGAEIQSTGIDKTSRGRDIAVIFGDGAGAAILRATDDEKKGVLTTHLHADGRHAKNLWCDWPSIHRPPGVEGVYEDPEHNFPHMNGRHVFKHAVVQFPEVIGEALEATGHKIEDVDLMIPHQANLRITEAVAKRLGLPMEKVYSNIQRYGNTTAASIPIALSEAWQEDKVKEDSLVCLAAFGSGFTWGSALVRF
jgi:3-oxoacyl-[acyl-carrier-protein] synthase-3